MRWTTSCRPSPLSSSLRVAWRAHTSTLPGPFADVRSDQCCRSLWEMGKERARTRTPSWRASSTGSATTCSRQRGSHPCAGDFPRRRIARTRCKFDELASPAVLRQRGSCIIWQTLCSDDSICGRSAYGRDTAAFFMASWLKEGLKGLENALEGSDRSARSRTRGAPPAEPTAEGVAVSNGAHDVADTVHAPRGSDERREVHDLRLANENLRDLLRDADQEAQSHADRADALQRQLAALKAEKADADAVHASAVQGLQAQVASLAGQLEEAKASKRAAEEAAAELRVARDVQQRHQSEDESMKSLREEVASLETKLEQERQQHAASRGDAARHQAALEAQLAEAAAAMGVLQRGASQTAAQLEDAHRAMAQLRAEAARRGEAGQAPGEGSDLASRLRRAEGELASSKEALRREEARARDAEARAMHLEARVRAMSEQLTRAGGGDRRAGESRADPGREAEVATLQSRVQSLTETLLQRQEEQRSERQEASVRIALAEQTAQRLRGELQALRAASQAQSSASAARPRMLIDDLVPLESFGWFSRLTSSSRPGSPVVSALRAVDRSTLACAALLKRYPPSRLAVPAYLLALHVLCYALIRRMQHHVLNCSSLGSAPSLSA